MVDIMNSNRKNALEKIYTPLLTFRRLFKFSKKNYFFFKNDILKESKYFITLRMIKCGKKNNYKFFMAQVFLIFMI